MKCRYCKQKLNLFKSLAGSSFCSPEHQKLYEEAEASKGFERLLQFVEKDGKPAPAAARPTPPLPPAEPQPIPNRAEKAPDSVPDPPLAGFLAQPIAPVACACPGTNANFEIPVGDFPAESPALPSTVLQIITEPVSQDAPPPAASWLTPALTEIDTARTSIEIPSVGPVRPRAIAVEAPSPEIRTVASEAPPVLLSVYELDLQPAIQAVDTRAFANLARLAPLQREIQPTAGKAQMSSVDFGGLTPDRPGAMLIGSQPAAAPSQDVALAITGAMAPAGMGRNMSALPAGSLWFSARLSQSTGRGQIPANGQDTIPSALPTIAPALLEQPEHRAPVMHWRLAPSGVSRLPEGSYAGRPRVPADRPVAFALTGAMTRAGLARAIRQPRTKCASFEHGIGSNEVLHSVAAVPQDGPSARLAAFSQDTFKPKECVAPVLASRHPRALTGMRPGVTANKIAVRELDTKLARGTIGTIQPAGSSIPVALLKLPPVRRSTTIGADQVKKKILAQTQPMDRSLGCPIAEVRQLRRNCLLPVNTAWSTPTRLKVALAAAGRLQRTDCAPQLIPSAAQVPSLFSIRFGLRPFALKRPLISSDRAARRFSFKVLEWNAEVQRLARSQSSRTSPLSIVVLPRPFFPPTAVRHIASLNRFAAVVNSNRIDLVSPALLSTLINEHKPALALPLFARLELVFAFRLTSQAALPSPLDQPIDRRTPAASSRPQPAPVRLQPASMLVLPSLAVPVGRIMWPMNVGWATVASGNLPQHEYPRLSGESTSSSSLRSMAGAVRIDRDQPAALSLKSKRPMIALDLGFQTSRHEVAAANALPRRRGPKLPVVTASHHDLLVAGR